MPSCCQWAQDMFYTDGLSSVQFFLGFINMFLNAKKMHKIAIANKQPKIIKLNNLLVDP